MARAQLRLTTRLWFNYVRSHGEPIIGFVRAQDQLRQDWQASIAWANNPGDDSVLIFQDARQATEFVLRYG